MILVDTSVWVDHLRSGNAVLAGLLEAGRVLARPCVTGELALGNLRQRDIILGALLWARDKRLLAASARVDLATMLAH